MCVAAPGRFWGVRLGGWRVGGSRFSNNKKSLQLNPETHSSASGRSRGSAKTIRYNRMQVWMSWPSAPGGRGVVCSPPWLNFATARLMRELHFFPDGTKRRVLRLLSPPRFPKTRQHRSEIITQVELSISRRCVNARPLRTASSKTRQYFNLESRVSKVKAKSDKLTQKMKLKKNSMYLMHLVQPATAMVAR